MRSASLLLGLGLLVVVLVVVLVRRTLLIRGEILRRKAVWCRRVSASLGVGLLSQALGLAVVVLVRLRGLLTKGIVWLLWGRGCLRGDAALLAIASELVVGLLRALLLCRLCT